MRVDIDCCLRFGGDNYVGPSAAIMQGIRRPHVTPSSAVVSVRRGGFKISDSSGFENGGYGLIIASYGLEIAFFIAAQSTFKRPTMPLP